MRGWHPKWFEIDEGGQLTEYNSGSESMEQYIEFSILTEVSKVQ